MTCYANAPSMDPHLYLIDGSFQDISRFAVQVKYIPILQAHHEWYRTERDTTWRHVYQGDSLLPGIYEFHADFPIVLFQLSNRKSHSVTNKASESNANRFRRALLIRDGACVVTRSENDLVASHFLPKRMGEEGVKKVMTTFTGEAVATDDVFDPTMGILLGGALNLKLGTTYTLHNFDADYPAFAALISTIPRLHLYSVTLSVHGGDDLLPPKGIMDWHYLQCFVKRFATKDYMSVPTIYFYEKPFKTDSDDDFDFDDNDDVEPLYPTYYFDRYMEEQGFRGSGPILHRTLDEP